MAKLKTAKICSYAKINLSIDVGAVDERGYHQVDMIMSCLLLHDLVTVSAQAFNKAREAQVSNLDVSISCNLFYVPTDERNICYKAALLMADRYGFSGKIKINLNKRVPVGAGLAGGSGNCAAVIHGLNRLWDLKLSLEELCNIGAELGSDVPFCVMAQAKLSRGVSRYLEKDYLATASGRARGTGTEVQPVKGMSKIVLMVKPNFSVSTRKVYEGIDSCKINERPDNDKLVEALKNLDKDKSLYDDVKYNMVNVLENYTLKAYPQVAEIKTKMESLTGIEKVLMSGSGPTVYGIFSKDNWKDAEKGKDAMRAKGLKVVLTKTMD